VGRNAEHLHAMYQNQLFQSQGQAPDVQEAIRELQQQIADLQRRQVKQQKQVIELEICFIFVKIRSTLNRMAQTVFSI
jgi:hypothetical protein